ncbi:RNA polymerase sigma factor [Planococcus salinarum]|uniref:RNA polymerase sigma factor n=1 Tax=Planococcus salinarum TaxID=622695 RepID=UPI000E3E4FAF|nr:hypothetical protein [Planococcus salinarum]TAA67874.1 hypothetical protein D2909_14485 [Planococcus salinarum]
MQSDDLLEKAKDGDRQAFVAWFQPYRDMISRLAYQAGIPKDKVDSFQLEVMKEISNLLQTVDGQNTENRIMQGAVRVLKKEQTEEPVNQIDDSIKFAEDLETHKAIQKLPFSDRIVFLLLFFHRKDSAETGSILDQPADAVEVMADRAIAEIRRQLASTSEADMQKRLDLLAKSYNRIQFPEEKDHLIEEIIAADEPAHETVQTEKTSVNRKTFAILAGASLFLSAVIGASFLFNEQPADNRQSATEEENPSSVSNEMVDNWEAEYEEIRASAPERLGLPVDTFEQLEFVRKADALKERTFSRQNVKQLRDDPERMQEQVDKLMLSIDTPKGMLDSVEDNTLLTSEVSDFLVIYTEKTNQLMVIADGLLEEYDEELAIAEVNGVLSPEKLTYNRTTYPEAIENLTDSLREYTLQYTVHPNENRFRTVRDLNKFYEIHPFNADQLSFSYLDILQNTPFSDESGLLWPIEQLPYSVIMMATFMNDPLADPILQGKVEPQLMQVFFTLLKGDQSIEIFNDEGIVKEEIQIAWGSLLQHNSNPVTYIMLPILEEFEASGWTESAHYDELAPPDILYAIDMENNGELAEKMPNSDVTVETETLQLEDYDYSDIQMLYEEFSANHNLEVLSGVAPMEIVKLYHYANKIEDIETMWHLTADDELKPSLEEYTSNWKKRPEITEKLRHIEIYGENMQRMGRKLRIMAFGQNVEIESDYRMMQHMTLVTEKDQIWLMQHQLDEYYTRDENFDDYDSNVQRYYNEIASSAELEAMDRATPAEIAGVFLLALEKEDLKTMRLLVYETDESISDEEFQERWIGGHLTVYSKMTAISFNVDAFNMDIHGIRGNVDIIVKSDSMEDSRYLPMEKAEGFWMIGDMFNY